MIRTAAAGSSWFYLDTANDQTITMELNLGTTPYTICAVHAYWMSASHVSQWRLWLWGTGSNSSVVGTPPWRQVLLREGAQARVAERVYFECQLASAVKLEMIQTANSFYGLSELEIYGYAPRHGICTAGCRHGGACWSTSDSCACVQVSERHSVIPRPPWMGGVPDSTVL
jgi:hypothetical protein